MPLIEFFKAEKAVAMCFFLQQPPGFFLFRLYPGSGPHRNIAGGGQLVFVAVNDTFVKGITFFAGFCRQVTHMTAQIPDIDIGYMRYRILDIVVRIYPHTQIGKQCQAGFIASHDQTGREVVSGTAFTRPVDVT